MALHTKQTRRQALLFRPAWYSLELLSNINSKLSILPSTTPVRSPLSQNSYASGMIDNVSSMALQAMTLGNSGSPQRGITCRPDRSKWVRSRTVPFKQDMTGKTIEGIYPTKDCVAKEWILVRRLAAHSSKLRRFTVFLPQVNGHLSLLCSVAL